jgi:hypothetical protein
MTLARMTDEELKRWSDEFDAMVRRHSIINWVCFLFQVALLGFLLGRGAWFQAALTTVVVLSAYAFLWWVERRLRVKWQERVASE